MTLRRYVYRFLGLALITGALIVMVARLGGVAIEIAILYGALGFIVIFGRGMFEIWRLVKKD